MDTKLQKRLDDLINQNQVMLFIKGTPEAPECGFSAKAMEILINSDIYFEYFNIYSDEEVRQGLKEYKNWSTYPQLYINSELIGWIDIMTEMYEDGEFKGIKEKLIK